MRSFFRIRFREPQGAGLPLPLRQSAGASLGPVDGGRYQLVKTRPPFSGARRHHARAEGSAIFLQEARGEPPSPRLALFPVTLAGFSGPKFTCRSASALRFLQLLKSRQAL